ncbi:MAG TPA: hypothetical protein VJK07_01570 [Candidatus Nanoarchaeia archaeon]|nr:hypothetical protein [Candidatus Nanoarchaeia archaeon]
MKQFKNPICIDFDGVLAEYDGYKGEDTLGKPLKGAREFLKKLNGVNLRWVVFTTRPRDKIINWFKEHNLPMPEEVTNLKFPSPVYIDDRAIKFDGNFDKLIKDMKNFSVYWNNERIFGGYFE